MRRIITLAGICALVSMATLSGCKTTTPSRKKGNPTYSTMGSEHDPASLGLYQQESAWRRAYGK